MSTLLPDESYCKSELGKLLYAGRKTHEYKAEVVDQREINGIFSHVEYDVVITVMPTDQIVNEPKKFKAATRYKEVNKLHSQLSIIHKQLYLKESVPKYPGPVMFGANSPEVTQERRKATGTFLNFVVSNPVLCKTKVLQEFVENFEELFENASNSSKVIIPTSDRPLSDLCTPVLGSLETGLQLPKQCSVESGPEELTEEEERVVRS
uniref:PX domain-containing protein n=1 Tax=Panagrolaimus superbus TaxID=310955 RepID=A0A914YQR7_9BILA